MKPALTIGSFEAKNRLSKLLQLVENGEEVTITRHGKAVARLVPVQGNEFEKRKEAIEWLKRTRKERGLDGMSIKDLINEGRKY